MVEFYNRRPRDLPRMVALFCRELTFIPLDLYSETCSILVIHGPLVFLTSLDFLVSSWIC